MIMKVVFNGVLASVHSSSILTTGMIRGRSVKFEFSPDWEGLSKTAVFTNGIATIIVREHKWVDNVVDIPPEVLNTPNVNVKCGVYGIDSSGSQVIPTLYADLGRVFPSASPEEATESVPPSPTIWDDLQNQIGVLSKLSTEDKRNLVSAINEVLLLLKNDYSTTKKVEELISKTVKSSVEQSLKEAKESGDFKGDKGDKGDTPEKGKDYFTPEDINQIVDTVIKTLPTWEGGSY